MRNRYPLIAAALFGVVSLGACQDKPQEIADLPSVPSAFPQLLFPPGGVLKTRAGSEDALQLVFHAPGDPEQLVDNYRLRLAAPPWDIIGDRQDGEMTTIYAEANGQPLWIRISPEPGVGSRVELNGAVLERTPAPAADSISPDSSAQAAGSADPARP